MHQYEIEYHAQDLHQPHFSCRCTVALYLHECSPIHQRGDFSTYTLLLSHALIFFFFCSSSFSIRCSSLTFCHSCCCIRSNLHLDSCTCMRLEHISHIASKISLPFSRMCLVDELVVKEATVETKLGLDSNGFVVMSCHPLQN